MRLIDLIAPNLTPFTHSWVDRSGVNRGHCQKNAILSAQLEQFSGHKIFHLWPCHGRVTSCLPVKFPENPQGALSIKSIYQIWQLMITFYLLIIFMCSFILKSSRKPAESITYYFVDDTGRSIVFIFAIIVSQQKIIL